MREFDLIQHIYAFNPLLSRGPVSVLIPPGDDMAMVALTGRRLLAAVDQLVAGRHFRLESTSLEFVGRKAVTRSLSDIAAMAATPVASLAAVTLPPGFGKERARLLFDAVRTTADAYGCPLVGGDIAFHSEAGYPLVCSVTVLAEPGSTPPITRSGAQPGDSVYVTGLLGGSLNTDGTGRHLTFEPRIREALELASKLRHDLHAMIDISDGLGRDAMHIAEESNVGIELGASTIPCNPGIGWKRAIGDGEDYELCFTAAAGAAVPAQIGAGVPVTRIGRVVAISEVARPWCVVLDGDQIIDVSSLGWEHKS